MRSAPTEAMGCKHAQGSGRAYRRSALHGGYRSGCGSDMDMEGGQESLARRRRDPSCVHGEARSGDRGEQMAAEGVQGRRRDGLNAD